MDKLRQVGFSLVEVIVATALFMGLVLVVSSLAISGSDAQDLGRRIGKMTEAAQEITDDLRLSLVSSVRLYGNDAEGNATLALLAMDREPTPTSVRRLPTIDIDGPFRQDSSTDEITGNALLFAYLAWRDRCRCASGNDYLVDVYRLVHYYEAPIGSGPAAGVRGGIDLVRFVSEPLADAEAIEQIVDLTDRAEVLLHLEAGSADAGGNRHDPVQVVWLRTGAPGAVGTLRQIDESDGSLSNTVLAGTNRPDPWAIKPITTGAESLLNYRHASVASNFDLVAPGISRFAVRDDLNGFPHGFEVQLIGPTASRQLLLHMVLIDSAMHGAPAWSQMQTVITARDR